MIADVAPGTQGDPIRRWPEMPAAWIDTYATLHMWSQIVGKVALAQAPRLNHSWSVALQLTSRGLMTRPLPHGNRTFTLDFDFLDHALHIVVADGERRSLPLVPQTVAAFYREVMTTLDDMKLPVRIWPMPVEIPNPIRFTDDTVHKSYDRDHVSAFWRILVNCERIFSRARCCFLGKASPVHFFWGSFDLAITRFSGRPAPPREGPEFMREAYSHEVISVRGAGTSGFQDEWRRTTRCVLSRRTWRVHPAVSNRPVSERFRGRADRLHRQHLFARRRSRIVGPPRARASRPFIS
jgi:hypothetical protein